MAVSTADFYTYAKETGTPLAQSNEERAALYPAVNQWKRSRLSIPRTESKEQYLERNDTGALETAAVLGGIVGAGLLGRRYLKNRPPTATKTPDIVEKGGAGVRTDYTQPKTWEEVKQKQTPKYKTTETVEKPVDSRGVQTVDIEVVQPDGQVIPTEVPSAPAPVKSPKEFSVYDYLVDTKTVDPQRQYVIDRISDPERVLSSLADEQLDIIRGTSPRGGSAIENAERTAEIRRQASLVNKNRIEAADQVREEIVSDQSINALGSAEDQQTGRVNRQLQRNEDLDQSQIAVMEEIAEEQDRRFGQGLESGEIAPGKEYGAPIDTVTQSLPDGPPVIQSEQRVGVSNRPTAQELLDKTKGEIIRVEDTATGQVRYAETRPDPSWVGAKSDIYTGTPESGPNLSASPIGQSITNERNKVISEIKKMGIANPKPSIIETELSRRLGKTSYDYGPVYTKLKNQIQLGVEDPRFLTDTKQDTKYVGGVELPIAVRNVFDNEATGSRQIKQPFIKEDKVTGRNLLAERAEQDFIDTKKDINTYWGEAKLDVYQQLNPLMKQTDALLEEQNMLLYSLNNQGPSRELSQRLGLVNKEIKTNQNDIAYLERRLSGIKGGQESQLEDVKKWVPTSLSDWRGEGTVVRPKPQLLRNKEIITDEGDALSALNQATQRVTDVGPEDLEIVPGGLLGGGYPQGITNIPKTDIYTGDVQNPIKLASGTSIRGMGGTDLDNKYVASIQKGTGGDFVSKYIGNKERILTRGGNILPNTGAAKNVPSGKLESYRKPAGQALDKQLNIAVTGGRTYDNYAELSQRLDQAINTLSPAEGTNINIIAGGATGADALAERYAKERNYGLTVKPADWDQYDKAAGPIRNREMAKLADVGIAFEGGTGTRNMIKTMGEEGKPILDTTEIQEATPQGRASVELSEQLRKIYSDQSVPPEVRKLNAENLVKSLGVQRTPTPQIVIDQGPVVTGADGITRGQGLRITPQPVELGPGQQISKIKPPIIDAGYDPITGRQLWSTRAKINPFKVLKLKREN